MKTKTCILFVCVLLSHMYHAQTKTNSVMQQLYMVGETQKPNKLCKGEFEEDALFGAMYLTDKGHVIFNLCNQMQDTVRYFWGEYKLTSSGISYTLNNEYFYAGKWDARWDIDEPDYKKGRTRISKPIILNLLRSNCDTLSFYAKSLECAKPMHLKQQKSNLSNGLYFFPYHETKDMKFYTWFYKQIPSLANL